MGVEPYASGGESCSACPDGYKECQNNLCSKLGRVKGMVLLTLTPHPLPPPPFLSSLRGSQGSEPDLLISHTTALHHHVGAGVTFGGHQRAEFSSGEPHPLIDNYNTY